MNKKRNSRWRMMADVKIQGQLVVRLIVYWILFQIVQVGTIAVFAFLASGDPNGPGIDTGLLVPSIVVSALVLPFVLVDALNFSNRFAGPVLRLGRNLKQLAESEPTTPLHFRPGDFHTELSEHFNKILERLPAQETEDTDCCPGDTEPAGEKTVGLECHV